MFCSFGKDEVTSSNLVSSSSETRCPARDSGFSLLFDGRGCPVENPYRNPYRQNFKDQIALRLIGFLQGIPENLACPTHTFLVGVRIHPECHGLIAMTQLLRYAGYISAIRDGDTCEGMPLWHNKDKSENPCGATGWRFVLILFPLKSGLKMGSTGGGDKQGLHLKDKFSHANSTAIILCNSSHKLLICFGIVVHICLIPAIILPAYLRIENARTCTTSSLGIFFKVSR